MRSKLLFYAMGGIDDSFVSEDAETLRSVRRKHSESGGI